MKLHQPPMFPATTDNYSVNDCWLGIGYFTQPKIDLTSTWLVSKLAKAGQVVFQQTLSSLPAANKITKVCYNFFHHKWKSIPIIWHNFRLKVIEVACKHFPFVTDWKKWWCSYWIMAAFILAEIWTWCVSQCKDFVSELSTGLFFHC